LVLSPESKEFEKIVDSTIEFIRKFAKAVKLPDKQLQWLYTRDEDGFFPPEIFDYALRPDFEKS